MEKWPNLTCEPTELSWDERCPKPFAAIHKITRYLASIYSERFDFV
jgi:hypothetical protein